MPAEAEKRAAEHGPQRRGSPRAAPPEASGPNAEPPSSLSSEREDALLASQAARGDRDAFRRLIEKHQDLVYDLCLRMMGNVQDAEDMAQDAFVLLYRHLRDYREGHKVSNWLYTIALNRCRRQLRKKKILRFFSLDFFSGEPEDPAPEPAGDDRAPGTDLERAEDEARTRAVLASLPDSLRAPFVLRHLKKMSYGEIAKTLKLSMANVKVRLHRAKLHLWKKFGKTPPGV
ncbi:MAG: RNA polymerase sigma factor [Elusimicrobia bacterium]|nr:RNA polymerase sigma factor [Elusimicrobiota bacterium]